MVRTSCLHWNELDLCDLWGSPSEVQSCAKDLAAIGKPGRQVELGLRSKYCISSSIWGTCLHLSLFLNELKSHANIRTWKVQIQTKLSCSLILRFSHFLAEWFLQLSIQVPHVTFQRWNALWGGRTEADTDFNYLSFNWCMPSHWWCSEEENSWNIFM